MLQITYCQMNIYVILKDFLDDLTCDGVRPNRMLTVNY